MTRKKQLFNGYRENLCLSYYSVYDWENYFTMIGQEQAILSLILNLYYMRACSQFSQSNNKWVIVRMRVQLGIYTTRDIWPFFHTALA